MFTIYIKCIINIWWLNKAEKEVFAQIPSFQLFHINKKGIQD